MNPRIIIRPRDRATPPASTQRAAHDVAARCAGCERLSRENRDLAEQLERLRAEIDQVRSTSRVVERLRREAQPPSEEARPVTASPTISEIPVSDGERW